MIINNLFYREQTAEYESKYSIEESVKKLQEIVKSEWTFLPTQQGIYGKVTLDYIRLYHIIPFVRNSFKLFFIGKFQHSNGKAVLKGVYTIHIFVKILVSIWFSGVIIMLIIDIFRLITGKESILNLWPMFLFPFGMIFFGIILIKVSQWFSRNDITYISKFIEDTLNK